MLQVLEGTSLVYPLWGLLLAAISLALVPRERYQYLLPHGLVGPAVAMVVFLIFDKLLRALTYVQAHPYAFWNMPFFVLVGWGAVTIIFLWGLPEESPRWLHWGYIALFAAGGMVVEAVFHQLGLRPHARWWRDWMGFFYSGSIFLLNYLIYRWRLKINPPQGS